MLSRRKFFTTAALAAAAVGTGGAAAHATPAVLPGQREYRTLTMRGYNRRYVARPRQIHLPATAQEVRQAVANSVRDGLRIAARSGGHCFEDFVDSAETRSLIDLRRLDRVDWDDEHRAFSVGSGLTLETLYTELARWDVTVPGGICRAVGVGGHISGGGYGPLSRKHGVVADHLYGVEVATVARDGSAGLVTATRNGPHRDLWWAHTGGGGGNFGIVTRYLLRSPGSDGSDPAAALPRPPRSMLSTTLILPVTTEDSFVRFMSNYLDFYAHHREPGNRFDGLYAPISFRPSLTGLGEMLIIQAADGPDARDLVDEFVATICAGVTPGAIVAPVVERSYADTVAHVYYAGTVDPPRVKTKAAYLRRPYTADQLRTCYRHIVSPAFVGESSLEFLPFGGAVNAVAPDATAMPARDSFMKMLIHAAWRLPADDDRHIGVARQLYRELYAGTGGVPVPDEHNGGSYINYPDPDLADPQFNRSGIPWHAFYYGENYPRLQRVKAQWDPGDVFRHRLSVALP
ncbi:FAD-binding oxidoreductase [Nocardia fusca]|uniref:FAD-binding oxidoreductase n=1 Tax=Nocardia fusca TaxID=941183 RepID=UPI003793C2B9